MHQPISSIRRLCKNRKFCSREGGGEENKNRNRSTMISMNTQQSTRWLLTVGLPHNTRIYMTSFHRPKNPPIAKSQTTIIRNAQNIHVSYTYMFDYKISYCSNKLGSARTHSCFLFSSTSTSN